MYVVDGVPRLHSGWAQAKNLLIQLRQGRIPYQPFVGYGQSKTACILLSVGIAGRWGGDNITWNSPPRENPQMGRPLEDSPFSPAL